MAEAVVTVFSEMTQFLKNGCSYTYCPHSTDKVDVDATIAELVAFVDDLYCESGSSDHKNTLILYYVLQFHHQVTFF